MKRPWMPFWPRDYLDDTMHLSAIEHAAYLLLIFQYWIAGGLPDDDRELARITKLPLASWRRIRPTIEAFFQPGWHHKRIDQEIGKADRKKERLQVAGSIGGTRAAIARQRGKQMLPRNGSHPSSETVATLVAKQQPGCSYSEEDITTNLSVAARARENSPTNSTPETADRPAGFAEKAREAVQKSTGIGSGELAATIAAKGWVPK